MVEQLLAGGVIDLHTTYFETVTAMAFLIFAEEGVERVVLEVGLGGRLDATNVVRPSLAVITPIDFDHEAYLGRGIESIAAEKAGILKPGVPAVFARQRPEAAQCAGSARRRTGHPGDARSGFTGTECLARRPRQPLRASGQRSRFPSAAPSPASTRWRTPSPPRWRCSPAASTARSIETGIAAAVWPGRLEHVRERPDDHSRRRSQPRRRPRAGRLHRPLLFARSAVPDLRHHARQGRRRNRRHPLPSRAAG